MILRAMPLMFLVSVACNGPTPPVISCATTTGAVHDCVDFQGLDRQGEELTTGQCRAQGNAYVVATPSEMACDTTRAIGGCRISLSGAAFKIDWFFPGNPYNDVPSVQHVCTAAFNGTFVPTPTPGDP